MARGQITEYDQGAFSPSATGAPQEDKSGQILSVGIDAVGKMLSERKEVSDNLSAMDKFGEFQLQYAQQKLDLQQQYRDKPEEFAVVAKTMSEKLAEDIGKEMPGGAAKKFKSLTTSALAQDMDNNVKWAFQRDNEIQIGKINSIKQNIALKASTVASPDGLAEIFNDFAAVSPAAQKFISKQDDDKLTKTYWDLAKKQAMSAQLMSSPNRLKIDLDSGKYNGILDPDEIKTYSDHARIAIDNRKFDDLYRTLYMAEDKTLNFVKGLDDGSANLIDLISEREVVFVNRKKATTPEAQAMNTAYLNNLDALIASQTQSIARTPYGKEKKAAVLGEFTRAWDLYLIEKKDGNKLPDPSDIDKELNLFKMLQDAKNSGVIDSNEFQDKVSIMTTKHKLAKNDIAGAMPFNQAIDQAGTVSGWWLWKKGNDVISTGYREIRERVDKEYPELLPEERTALKAQLLSQYHQQVKSMPPEQIKKLTEDSQRIAFARRILLGGMTSGGGQVPGLFQANSFFKDPVSQKEFRMGDKTKDAFGNEKIFSGKDSLGKPIWKYIPGQIITGANGKKFRVNSEGQFERL
jgi:hypothetical protein